MGERPILFSAPMVRALLVGKKTQTRRVAIRQDIYFRNGEPFIPTGIHSEAKFSRPGWEIGDRLWVRERWRTFVSLDDVAPAELLNGKRGAGIRFEADGMTLSRSKDGELHYDPHGIPADLPPSRRDE